MRVFKTVTLGCKVNQYETEYVRQGLLGAGYREAAPDEPADLCIVNTCTVTVESDYKGRKIIRALARENPQTEIIVMGCYATRAAGEVASLPRVMRVVTDKRQLPELVRELAQVEPPAGIAAFDRLHRACVKVQDGCTQECSYCIVPKVRPVPISRPISEVLEEVRRLVDHGHREIVLTGIHLGCYGAELPVKARRRTNLVSLLRAVVGVEGEFRVRLSSLEAPEIDPELLQLMADFPERICPHLHIPLQSGSDAVLQRMRRRYTIDQFLACCARVRAMLRAPALTTDVIVGFPGESDVDFETTCDVVRQAQFAKLHVFRFSPREGTAAATMPNQISPAIKQLRANQLAEIGRQLRQAFCASLIGQELQVVAERVLEGRPSQLSGTADRYVTVRFPGGPELMDHLVRVTAERVAGECILATSARAGTSLATDPTEVRWTLAPRPRAGKGDSLGPT